jgi:hypothetical protein
LGKKLLQGKKEDKSKSPTENLTEGLDKLSLKEDSKKGKFTKVSVFSLFLDNIKDISS